MKIALASPPYPASVDNALYQAEKLIQSAAPAGAEIICFPETYLPGYPGLGYDTGTTTQEMLESALTRVCKMAAANSIAVIMPMDWHEAGHILNVAQVVSAKGEWLGYQTKNQLDPTEDNKWTPGTDRNIFEVNGVKFSITICHEGFRYPESVRWAAMKGASIVFHPNCTGNNTAGKQLTEWGHQDNPYYEKAQLLRAMENTIYFAGVNYHFKYPDSASALIGPDGTCIAHQSYTEAGVLVAEINIDLASGSLAKRFKPALYNYG